MEEPKLKNILILGMFSDNKVRQIFCDEKQQRTTIDIIIALDPDATLRVSAEEVKGITWESQIEFNKKPKYLKSKRRSI
jgi:hypothetical protein